MLYFLENLHGPTSVNGCIQFIKKKFTRKQWQIESFNVVFLLFYFALKMFVFRVRVWHRKICNCHSIFLFLFPLFVALFEGTGKSFLGDVFINKALEQDLSYFLETPKNVFVKVLPLLVICNACGTWHSLWTVASTHNIQKSPRNS